MCFSCTIYPSRLFWIDWYIFFKPLKPGKENTFSITISKTWYQVSYYNINTISIYCPEFLFSNRLGKWEIWTRPCHRDKVRAQNRPFMDVLLHALLLCLGPRSIHLQNSAFRWTNSHQTPTKNMCFKPHLPTSSHTRVGPLNRDIMEQHRSDYYRTHRETVYPLVSDGVHLVG